MFKCDWLNPFVPELPVEIYFKSYSKRYHGKEELVLIQYTATPQRRMAPKLQAIAKDLRKITLESEMEHPSGSMRTNQGNEQKEYGTYDEREQSAVVVMQRFWRRKYPYLERRRAFSETRQGQARKTAKQLIQSEGFPCHHEARAVVLVHGAQTYAKEDDLVPHLQHMEIIIDSVLKDTEVPVGVIQQFFPLQERALSARNAFETASRKTAAESVKNLARSLDQDFQELRVFFRNVSEEWDLLKNDIRTILGSLEDLMKMRRGGSG